MRFFGKKDARGVEGVAGEAAETNEQSQKERQGAGLLERMRQAVERTRESLGSRIEGIVALTRTVDERAL